MGRMECCPGQYAGIPFITHGGSGTAGTPAVLSEKQPDAQISDNVFSIARERVADGAEEVIAWAQGLGLND